MAEVLIQGIMCTYRDILSDEEILYKDLPKDEQYFKRIESPLSDDDLVSIATKEEGYRMTSLQQNWVDREEKRMNYGNGVYASINGILKYIPASYWGYINYWTLENGKKPDYREADRRFFLFMEYICFETEVLAITRGKGRRKGATSQGAYWEWWICGRNEEKIGGMISFNDDAAQAVYQKMFMRGFTDMLPCFVRDFDSTSENFIRFVKPVEKKKKGVPVKRQGLNSYIGYKSNNINSYDSGRVSFGLFDESGKYEKMDINTYWSKVSATLKEGLYKVGFAYLPTTVNPKKKGGENYKKFWKLCNQNAINPNTGELYGLNTPNGVVRYLDPATEGYAGCIDKFGESVVEDPPEPIIGNDGKLITKGSLRIIKEERSLKIGEQLMEHRRDFPLNEADMFSFETGQCEFNEPRIREQIEYIEVNKEKYFLRRVRLVRREKTEKNITNNKDRTIFWIEYEDDVKGDWYLWEKPIEENKFKMSGTYIDPLNISAYTIGVDTFKDEFAYSGSKGTICIFKKSCIKEGEETGMYPVLLYIGRPRLLVHLYDEVMKACLWYGCKVNFELDAGTQYYNYFQERGAGQLLEWTPKICIDPVKRDRKIKPGTQSADPFQLQQQLEVCKTYIDGSKNDLYGGHVHRIVYPQLLEQLIDYNHSERTPYDIVISLMMSLLPAMGSTQESDMMDYKPKKLLPQFKIKMAV